MDLASLRRILYSAAERKCPRMGADGVGRLINGFASGIPGLVLEWFGGHGLAYDYGFGDPEGLYTTLYAFAHERGWKSLTLFDRRRAGVEERETNRVLLGEPPEYLVVHDGPLKFQVELRHPRNPGLFLDTGEVRAWLRANSSGKNVLNLFAYTGSLGLAALAGGAGEVVQVDVSRRYLDWGRKNLHLNGLPEAHCQFKSMDAERYLDWASGKNKAFDCVILDPPVFARFEGGDFRFERDYFRLVSKSSTLLASGGILFAVTNYSGIALPEFRDRLHSAVKGSGRTVATLTKIPLPLDFDEPSESVARAEGNALIFRIETS